ncbi:unnamed protein product [Dicrocoelium dendriticum]|nr:unnamed protein product [Dicrocoelium dendriticum]
MGAKCLVTLIDLVRQLPFPDIQPIEIFNAEVIFREDCTPDEFIDVVLGNRVYLSCIYVYNKIDQISLQEVDQLARRPHSVVVSCNLRLNLDYLLEKLWEYLDLIQVYTKKRGEHPDLENGLILRNGCTVEHVCHMIHRSLVSQFKCALVWASKSNAQSASCPPVPTGVPPNLDVPS